MKKIFYTLVSLSILAFASCNKLGNTPEVRLEPAPAPESFTVNVPGSYETKTTLDGLKPKWVTGDEIRVYGHNTDSDTYTDNAVYELKSGNGEGTAVFTLKSGETGLSGTYNEFYAVYPSNLTVSGLDKGNIVLPRLNSSPSHLRMQNPAPGQIDPKLAIMTAKYNGSTMSFRHGVAYIKITIPSDGITKIDINLNNASGCLADTPTYDASTGALKSVSNSAKNVTSAEGTFVKGESYYFAAIPRKDYHIGTTIITFNDSETVSTNHFSGKDVAIGKVFDLGTPAKPTVPYFTADDVDIDADETAGSIDFTVSNLVDGGVVTKSVVSSTIANLSLGAVSFNTSTGVGSVSFTCDENDDDENDRTAVVQLTYTYGSPAETKTKNVTITQKKAGVVVLVPVTATKIWNVANNFSPLATSKGTSALSETFIDDNLEYICGGKIQFNASYLRFGGTGTPTDKCVRFLIAGPGTLTVNAKSAKAGDASRSIKIAHNGTANADVFSVPEGGSTAESHNWTISTASSGDVIAIYSGNSGVNVYSITWTPAS